jgi:hypothetical protein
MTKHEEVETILAKIHNTTLALDNSKGKGWAETYWNITQNRLQRQLHSKLYEIDNPKQWNQVFKVTY